ncbi:Bacterial extracellular solute-binding protein [compost metagenome]
MVDFEVIDLERACSEGLLEEIPRDILPPGIDGTPAAQDFIPEAMASECAIGNIVWSVVFAYNENTIGGTKATALTDFFDTAKIPGKRAMRKRPQVNLEWALLADGVPPAEVYEVLATPEGQQRAFDKLATIKKDIVWFDSWSQAPQLLNDGGAVLVQSANGRFYDAIRQEKKPFVIVWDGHIYDLDAWAIVKGSPKKDLALKFIAYATGSKPLAGMPDVAYGPTRKSSTPLMDQTAAPHLPTAHLDKGIQAGSEFWADHGESLGEKFNEWLLN